MALSCFLRKISPTVLRGSVLRDLNKNIVLRSCSVPGVPQTQYHQVATGGNPGRELSVPPLKSCQTTSLLIASKQFSTSSALLASHKGHDHSKIWTFERVLSLALVPLIPAALFYPLKELDAALALAIVLHTHFGFEAIVVDYVRPILFGKVVPKIALVCVYLLSIVTFAGLLNLIYNDAGLANTIIEIWKK